jgi:hypothetical protein
MAEEGGHQEVGYAWCTQENEERKLRNLRWFNPDPTVTTNHPFYSPSRTLQQEDKRYLTDN